MSSVKLTDLIAPSFYKLHKAVKSHKFTHYWLKGGRGSTKSTFIGVEIPLLIMTHKEINAVVMRKVADTLHDSVYEQICWAINKLGVAAYFKCQVSPLKITYIPTGQQIIFRGTDDPLKLKSIKLRKGYFGIVWFEELAEFDSADKISNILQSLLRGGSTYWCFYSYNPPASVSSWVNYESVIERPDKVVHESTYLTVPKEWLGEQFIAEADEMKKTHPEAYEHQYLGKVTGTGGEVFRNVTARSISDDEIQQFDRVLRGLDWGYAADPVAYIVGNYDSRRKILTLYYEYYKVNCSNEELAKQIKMQNNDNGLIYCDSAEPKSIAYLNSCGIRATACKKYPGSVETGYRFMSQEVEIVVDPARCPNTYRELTTYELERDKQGNWKAGYPDRNNHTLDAIHYMLDGEIPGSSKPIKSFHIDI